MSISPATGLMSSNDLHGASARPALPHANLSVMPPARPLPPPERLPPPLLNVVFQRPSGAAAVSSPPLPLQSAPLPTDRPLLPWTM
jgi:hypothetical protein